MDATIQLDAMLTSSPDVCGGRLRIDGTRITVLQIVTLYKRGESADEIAAAYSHLSLAQVHAALAYYHSHQAEVECALADEQLEAEQLEKQHAGLRRP